VVQPKDSSLKPIETKLTALVDPEGYVYTESKDGRTRIAQAEVSLYWLNPERPEGYPADYELWPAEQFLQKNPVTTDITGKYSFLVPEGQYYLTARAKGYVDFEGDSFSVKDNNNVHIDIKLKKSLSLFSWLDWQTLVVALLCIVIILLAVLVFTRRKL